MNDTELIDLINANEAWLTYASDQSGTDHAWRCVVQERWFPVPDIRERARREGFGCTAREAVAACFATEKTTT